MMVSRATKATLLWGVVGGLSFLVLIQGYELLTPVGVDFVVKALVAVLVAVVAAVTAHFARPVVLDRG